MKLSRFIPDEFRNVHWATLFSTKKICLLIGLGTWMGYICFSHPLTWNFRTDRICYVTGSFHRLVRNLCLFLVVSFTGLQAMSIAYDLSQGQFNITSLFGVYRVLSLIYCTFPTVMQLNLALMPEEEIQLGNHSLEYYEIMKTDVFESPAKVQKFDTKCTIIMILVSGEIFFTQIVGLAAYVVDCRFHPLSWTFPICDADAYTVGNQWHLFIGHYSNPMVFIAAFTILYVATMQLVCASSGFMLLIMCPILGCKIVLDKMKIPVNKLKKRDPLRNGWNWLMHYRMLQMLLTQINVFVGKYVLPILLFLAIALIVGVNFILLGLEDQPLFKAAGVVINIAIIGMLTFNIKAGAAFVQMSEEAVGVRREEMKEAEDDASGFERTLDTCRPLLTNVGPFMKVERLTILNIYATIVDYTTELLLLDQ